MLQGALVVKGKRQFRVDEIVKHFILKYQKIRGPRIYKSYHNSINKR